MQPFNLSANYTRNHSVSTCRYGKDHVSLYHADTGREKIINQSGFRIWQKLDGEHTGEEVARDLFLVVNAPENLVRKDVSSFMQELLTEGYIVDGCSCRASLITEDLPGVSERPESFDISLTGKCNLHCEYCFYAKEMHDRPDLPIEEWFKFFDELGRLGVRSLTLSGGEVFVRKDLWEIIDYLIEKRMRYSILSNGTLITEDTIEKFKKGKRLNRLNSVQVSIDGSCAEVHDRSRGKGSFERAIKGLRLLKEAGFPVTSRLTINRHNVDDLENIVKLLLEDVGLRSFGTNDAIPMGAGCDNQTGITLSPQQQLNAIITMHQLDLKYPGRIMASAGPLAKWRTYGEMEHARATGEKTARYSMGYLTACGCMFNKLSVHHDGIISPCNMLPGLEMGRINQVSIKQIWLNSPILRDLKKRRQIPMSEVPDCKGCEWQEFCNGSCPGLPYTQTGDINRANLHDCYRKFLQDTGLKSPLVPWAE